MAAPTLTVAARLGLDSARDASATPALTDAADLTDFIVLAAQPTVRDLVIEITEDNHVVVQLPRAEVGQGITTTMAILVADELDAWLVDVDMRLQDATPSNQANQLTGGSSSVSVLYDPIREVSAAIRARLVTAAAERWGLDADTLTTRDTKVLAPDGRSATYGSLSAAAAEVIVPAVDASPKEPGEFSLVGKATNRIDARDLVTGRAKFTLDVDVPGAVPTVMARPPMLRGTVAKADGHAARRLPGVIATARTPTGVAVAAETFGHALRARDALQVTWNDGPLAGLSDADVFERLHAATNPFGAPAFLDRVSGEFDFAFVNHAPMEVMVAVADVRADRAELWFPSKAPIVAQAEIAKELGLPVDAVTCHVVRAGGSFGRRLFHDPALEAALISQKMKRPVKLMYTRSDDMHHGRMRPASHHKVQATYRSGSVLSWEHRAATTPLDLRHGFGEAYGAAGADAFPGGYSQFVFHTTQRRPYEFGAESYDLAEIDLDVPTSAWRAVFSGTAAVSDEIMVDELAAAMREDAVAFRLRLLSGARERAVLQRVAQAGGWGRPMPAGHAQGVAVHHEYKGCIACLVEIDASDRLSPRVTKAVAAVDVGRAINPRGLEAQVLGHITDGISTVLYAGNHLENGTMRESSFADFPWARMRNTPPVVQVHVMPPTTGIPGGAGELGVPAASAAVANAYARATGTRPRTFPILGGGA